MSDSNTELLVRVAEALGDLREQMVFLGGCATAILITDSGVAPIRATQDVDAVVAITSLADYRRLGKALGARGFSQSIAEGEPPYRWTLGEMKLDLMPTSAKVFGFSNRWYPTALRTAVAVSLRESLRIRLVAPPCFLATKLEAFEDRGQDDYLASRDLEDVLSVIDGRPEIVGEVAAADSELRRYVAEAVARLLADREFLNTLPGLVMDGSPATRLPLVLERLRLMAQLKA